MLVVNVADLQETSSLAVLREAAEYLGVGRPVDTFEPTSAEVRAEPGALCDCQQVVSRKPMQRIGIPPGTTTADRRRTAAA